jgi:hypothetical protein
MFNVQYSMFNMKMKECKMQRNKQDTINRRPPRLSPFSMMHLYRFEMTGDPEGENYCEIYAAATGELRHTTPRRADQKLVEADCLKFLQDRADEAQAAIGGA